MTEATAASSEFIQASRDGAVAVLRIARPDKKNALTTAMYAALTSDLTRAEADPAVAVHCLLGVPGAFSAGNDLEDFLAFSAQGKLGTEVLDFLNRIATLDKPLVIGVDGLAIGIGTTLLLHADLALASDRSLFRTPFTDLGLVPEAASSLLGPRLMGHVKAFELLVLGAPFDAAAAEKAGLVNKVVAADALEPATLDLARALAAKPHEAVAIGRALLRQSQPFGRAEVQARIALEGEKFKERLTSAEAQAAFRAFLTKKKS